MSPRASIRFLLPNGEQGVEFLGDSHAVYALVNFLNAVPSFLAPIAGELAVVPNLMIHHGNQMLVCPVNTPFLATYDWDTQTVNSMAEEMVNSMKQSFDKDTLSFVLQLDENLNFIPKRGH